MSTKTTFKRIALVAVAALGLGVLSVAPSSATPTGVTVTVTNGSAGLPGAAADSSTAATLVIAGLLETNDSVTVELVSKSYPAGGATSSAQVYLYNLDSTTPTLTGYTVDTTTVGTAAAAGTFPVTGATAYPSKATTTVARISKQTSNGYVNHVFGVQFDSNTATTRVAGTYTYTALIKTWAGAATPAATTTQDVSIVIAKAASTSTTVDATKLSAFIGTSSGATSDANISAVATADSTVDAYITVKIANASGDTTSALDSVTATVTGPGLISFDGTTYGKSIKYAATGNAVIRVLGDGTAGTSSIAVTTTSGLSVAKTMTFYAKDPKTITPTAFTPILVVGSNDSAVAVTAVDANGINWTGALYIYPVAAADALVSGSTTAAVACVASSDNTKKYCPLTTKATGTASFKVGNNADPSLATVTSDAVKVTVSNATPATVKLAFDKATYAPGEKAVVTVTPLDSTGAKFGAVSSSALLAAGITSNVAVTIAGSTTATVLSTADGSAVSTSAYDGTDKTAGTYSIVVYMPQASGTVTLTGKGGTALPLAGQVAVTASATVANASVDAATDAANEATDAANAATDAALAAADAADAATAAAQDASDAVAALSAQVEKLVASLKAQLTSLTNLVIKIQKKVKA